jgi:MFS superfamily sulfate permease-like transporter
MVKWKEMRHLYRVRRLDFLLALIALLALLTIEILQSLLLAVVVSLLALVWHTSQPKVAVLGRVPGTLDFSDLRKHPDNRAIPGFLMVRPENGLFFANATGISEAIIHEVNASTVPVEAVMMDLGAPSELDAPSADMLVKLHAQLRERNVRFILTRMAAPVRHVLARADTGGEIGEDDIRHSPLEAFLDFIVAEAAAAADGETKRVGLLEARDVLRGRMSEVPAERRRALGTILAMIDTQLAEASAGEVPGAEASAGEVPGAEASAGEVPVGG